MKAIPWREVATWRCRGCGGCCKPYTVQLRRWEWTRITQTYGASATEICLDGLFLKKRQGRCVFQYRRGGKWLCRIQHMKPRSCKLWPFKIFRRPKYGKADRAAIEFEGNRLFIYADPLCQGLKLGRPSTELLTKILPEFLGISLNTSLEQHHSTMHREKAYPRYPLAVSRVI